MCVSVCILFVSLCVCVMCVPVLYFNLRVCCRSVSVCLSVFVYMCVPVLYFYMCMSWNVLKCLKMSFVFVTVVLKYNHVCEYVVLICLHVCDCAVWICPNLSWYVYTCMRVKSWYVLTYMSDMSSWPDIAVTVYWWLYCWYVFMLWMIVIISALRVELVLVYISRLYIVSPHFVSLLLLRCVYYELHN